MAAGKVDLLGRYLEVTGTFGFAEKGGLVVNEALKTQERKLSGSVSRVVGFTVRNSVSKVENSFLPVVFSIPVRRWAPVDMDSDVYKATETVVVLNPGDSAIFESRDFIAYMLNNKETHGLSLANGVIKRSSRGCSKESKLRGLENLKVYTVDEAEYFCFSFSPNCALRLHDPEIKKAVGVKRDGVWKVKDQYKEYFGFLEMSGVHARRARRIVQQQIAERIRASYQLEENPAT